MVKQMFILLTGSETRLVGRMLIVSGRTGKILTWANVPDQRETYFSPVIYERNEGLTTVLFGTGGETHSGSLWAISLSNLYSGQMDKVNKILLQTIISLIAQQYLHRC